MITQETLQQLSVAIVPILFAITLHEAAHGYVARSFGDPTAEQAGRISLNPIRHIDPVGTILVPMILLIFTGGMFGWAKPVPVDFNRLRNPKRDMLWVAAAGPGANLLMAIGWALLLKVSYSFELAGYAQALHYMCISGIYINIILMVLNLLPLPPLDGGRIAISLLPIRQAIQFSRLEPYGIPALLLVFIFFRREFFEYIINPLSTGIIYFISFFF